MIKPSLDIGDGPTVLFLHGFPQGPASWSDVAKRVASSGYRAVVLTQRGYDSNEPLLPRSRYTFENLAQDAIDSLDDLGAWPCSVVGHDLGAAVAWRLASKAHDRVSHVTSVSLAYPAAFVESCLMSDQALRSWYFLPAQSVTLSRYLFSPDLQPSKRRFARMLRSVGMTESMADKTLTELGEEDNFAKALRWYQAIPFDPPRKAFATCLTPSTIITGSEDKLTTRTSIKLSSRWMRSGLRVSTIAGMTHWLTASHSDALVEQVLRDLD